MYQNIDETELVYKTSNESDCRCSLCTVYKVLFSVFFVISPITSIYFVYCKYVDCKKYILIYWANLYIEKVTDFNIKNKTLFF